MIFLSARIITFIQVCPSNVVAAFSLYRDRLIIIINNPTTLHTTVDPHLDLGPGLLLALFFEVVKPATQISERALSTFSDPY